MLNRRDLVTRLVKSVSLAGIAPALFGEEPWTPQELLEPIWLAKRIEAGTPPPIICVTFPFLYRQRHIRGAKFAGPGNKPEGIQELEELASSLSKEAEVVLYCGCCPMKECPNIRPACVSMKRMKFTTVRVLNLPGNLHKDWTVKGYPCEPQRFPRPLGTQDGHL